MKKSFLLFITHVAIGVGGFFAGIYALPIIIAPPAPTLDEINTVASGAVYTGRFQRDLMDSDFLHWGDGQVFVGSNAIALQGKLAPGPAYRLYLSPEFVETEADFKRLKTAMAAIGDIKTFDNFLLDLPRGVDPAAYNSVIIWCESYEQFISAARYRRDN